MFSLVSATLPLSAVDDYGQITLAQQISQLPGIAQVQVFGSQKFAVRVQVDPVSAALAVSRSTMSDLRYQDQLQHACRTVAGARQNTILTATAAMRSAAEYRELVIAYRNGQPVKLKEIANVVDGGENDRTANLYNNERSIVLAVFKQPDANTVKIVDSIYERLPTYRAQIPASVKMELPG